MRRIAPFAKLGPRDVPAPALSWLRLPGLGSSRLGSASLGLAAILTLTAPLLSCGGGGGGGGGNPTFPPPTQICEGYPDWRTSPYVLPYPVGETYTVSQENCSGGHSLAGRYAYDFWMPIGTEVSAARAGTVETVVESHADGDHSPDHANLVRIAHDDGTFAVYAHLTRNGALVDEGEQVEAGDLIALSGNTGSTGGKPHLHFDVAPCPVVSERTCETLPVTFRNTDPNPHGLEFGHAYPALPFS